MSIPVELIGNIADFMAEYRYVSLFLSVLITGETAIMVASMLVRETVFSFGTVFWLIFLAALIADTFWFTLFRLIPIQRLPKYFQNRSKAWVQNGFRNTFVNRNIFTLMLFSKFFYGTRLAFTAYLAFSKMSFSRFLIYDMLGCLLYVYVFMLAGLEIQRFLTQLFPDTSIAIIFSLGLVIFLLLLVILNYFKKYFN